MRPFQVPGAKVPQSKAKGLDKGDKRKLFFMALGLVMVIIALAYSSFRGDKYEQAELDEFPLEGIEMVEQVDLPRLDGAAFDALVTDAAELDRVVLEGEAIDAILPTARTLTPRHYEAMGARELDAALIESIDANPSAHRLEPFTARGFIDSIRTRRRGDSNDVEHIGRLLLDDASIVYFLVLDAPESAGYVRVDGLFMKVHSDEDDLKPGEWNEGPLLVGHKAVRSYRSLGEVTEPHWGLYRSVTDAQLIPPDGGDPRVVRETPFEPFWHMMAYARDQAPDAIDWDAAPELDDALMKQLLDDPETWRGQPIRIPISRVQDGRVVAAGENPARVERYTQGWLGNWNWPNVVRFRYPHAVSNIRLRDYVYGKGFFLHDFAYESKGRGLRVAPLIVLTDMTRFETTADPIFNRLGMIFGALVIGLGGLFTFLLVRDRRRSSALRAELSRRKRARRDVPSTSPSA